MLTLASLKKGQAKVGTYIHTWRTMKDKYMAGHGPVFWCCEHRYYYRSRIGIEIQKSKIQKYLSRRAIFSLLITSHYCCELVLTQKKVAKHIIGKNGSRDLYRSPNHQYGNHMSCPYGGPVVHRQKTPPNMGRLGCVCQVLSPKGHDCSFQYWWFWLPHRSLEPFLPLKCLATFFCVNTSLQ